MKFLNIVKFSGAVSEKIRNLSSEWLEERSVEECAQKLTAFLQKAREVTHCRSGQLRARRVLWWIPDLNEQRRAAAAARRRYMNGLNQRLIVGRTTDICCE